MTAAQDFDITFGDCDPAGIVFYPNAFRWMDAGFHTLLRPAGGHATLCRNLKAVGVGLVDASAEFRRPMRDGDRLSLRITITEWSHRSFTLHYDGTVEGKRAFRGREVRCLFTRAESGIVAADVAPLRVLLETENV
jgi:4-hydroxybenzoyl-CoA thioesterase